MVASPFPFFHCVNRLILLHFFPPYHVVFIVLVLRGFLCPFDHPLQSVVWAIILSWRVNLRLLSIRSILACWGIPWISADDRFYDHLHVMFSNRNAFIISNNKIISRVHEAPMSCWFQLCLQLTLFHGRHIMQTLSQSWQKEIILSL